MRNVPVGTLGKVVELTVSYYARTRPYAAIGCESIDAERRIALSLQVLVDFRPKRQEAKGLAGTP